MTTSTLSRLAFMVVVVLGLGLSASSSEAQTATGVTRGAAPPSAAPQPPPRGPSTSDRWWENPPVEQKSSGTKVALKSIGGGLAGLGALALLGASITWMVALGEAEALDDECYDYDCYENSRGGEALVRARDAEKGAGIVAGIGVPVLVSGLVVLLFGAGMDDRDSASVHVAPTVASEGGGLTLEARF